MLYPVKATFGITITSGTAFSLARYVGKLSLTSSVGISFVFGFGVAYIMRRMDDIEGDFLRACETFTFDKYSMKDKDDASEERLNRIYHAYRKALLSDLAEYGSKTINAVDRDYNILLEYIKKRDRGEL